MCIAPSRTPFLRKSLWVPLVVLGAVGSAASALAAPPSGADKTVYSPGSGYVFQTADFGFSDADADAFIAVKISTLPAQGTLQLDGASVAAGQFVPVADITAGKLAYTPVAGSSGSFTFQVQDDGTGNANAVTLLTNQPAIASALNANGTATAALATAMYPGLEIVGQFVSGSNSWSTWQPPVLTVSSTLFGSSITFPTAYLDEGSPRTSTWTFQHGGAPATAASLATPLQAYTYVFGIAGLGGDPEYQTITSSVPLTVIGNGDAFGTGQYSLLDGAVSTTMGMTGTVISTQTGVGSQGYTFFSLPGNISSITLAETGDDAHGIVFGVVETTLVTLDSVAKTMTIMPDVPSAPPTPSASAGNAQATVQWSLPSADGGSAITSYVAAAVEDPGKTCTATPPAMSCIVTGLANGSTYTFTVRATNANGTGAASTVSNAVTPSAPPVPSAPLNPAATAGNGQATVSWSAPASGGPFTLYTVTAVEDPTKTCTATPPATRCVVSGLTNGRTYTFTVTASNASGTGTASAVSNAVTPQAPSSSVAPIPTLSEWALLALSTLLALAMAFTLRRQR